MKKLDCRVTTHGERELEAHLVYPLSSDSKRSEYCLDWYIFSPPQLAVEPPRYTVRNLMDDLQVYVRYSTPIVPLAKLADKSCDISPLIRIRRALADGTAKIGEQQLQRELRLLTNIFHDQMRENRVRLCNMLESQTSPEMVLPSCDFFLEELAYFLDDLRSLHILFLDPRVKESDREGLHWADEAISLRTEKTLMRLHKKLGDKPELEAARQKIMEQLRGEARYRAKRGYASVVEKDKPLSLETFLFRESVLKKWSQSALYLSLEHAKTVGRIAHIIAGFAAAVAMAFAVAATVAAQQYYAQFTLPWAILVVIAYIFKDRLKEMLREALISRVPRLVADDVRWLKDHSGKKAGLRKARVIFAEPAQLPGEIIRVRNLKGNPFQGILPQENVVQYHLETVFFGKALPKDSLSETAEEIMRLNLHEWMVKMDTAMDQVSFVDGDRVETGYGQRVYHLNMVLALSEKQNGKVEMICKYRGIVTRSGIIRVEHVESLHS